VADTMTIGRTTQMSPETVHGAAPGGGATKQLIDLTFQMDPSLKAIEVRGTGRRFLTVVVPDGQEATVGKVGGSLGYNSWAYIMSMCFGAATITTPAGGVNARKWAWTVPLTGSIDPKSMDIEQGDTADAEQFLYSVITDWGVDATRAQVTPAGSILARAVNKASATGSFTGMTSAGLTTLALAPVMPDDWSVFMDLSSSAIGTTKLLRAFHAKLDYGGAFQPFFPLDAALPSYGGIADGEAVKATMMIEMMKDPLVGEALWPVVRAGQTRYIRLNAGGVGVSPLIDNYQTITITGTATGGTFTVQYKGVTSATIAFNAISSAVQTILGNMSSIGVGNVTVAGGPLPGTPMTVTFTGVLANDTSVLTIGTNSLTGTSPVPVLASFQIPYSMTYDMAGKIAAPGANKDLTGLRTREWTFDIVEDPTWGNALLVTLINNLTAL
jgi:hypothetical protein